MTKEYLTWVIRYVPNSIRGEFINIGVLVGGPGKDWAIRYVSNFKRANQLGGDAAKLLPILQGLRQRIPKEEHQADNRQLAIDLGGTEPLSAQMVESLRVHQQNVLQFSEARPSYGHSAASVAELLYSHLILEHVREPVPKTIVRLRNEYEEALDERLPSGLEYSKQVQAGFGHRSETFDFAIHGGSSVEQLTHTFNFGNKDHRRMSDAVDALTLRFTSMRDMGASVSLGAGGPTLPFPKDRPLYVVHSEPIGKLQMKIFEMAAREWSNLGIERLPEQSLLENPRLAIAA